MTTIYTDADLEEAFDQKNRIFCVFALVTALYIGICVGIVVYFTTLPYLHPNQKICKTVVYILTGIYVLFAFPFWTIKYGRAKSYYRMVYYLSEGLKISEENYFVGFAKRDLQKDHVDVFCCIFKEWSKKKCDWMERVVYCDMEKPLPNFEAGDLVRYVTQGNMLIQYEVVGHKHLDEL